MFVVSESKARIEQDIVKVRNLVMDKMTVYEQVIAKIKDAFAKKN